MDKKLPGAFGGFEGGFFARFAPMPDYNSPSHAPNRDTMRRRHWFAIILLPAFLVAADTAYWWVTSDRLRRGVEDWIATQRAHGWTVDTRPVLVGGWPWSAEASTRDFAVRHAAGDLPGNLSWSTAAITFSVSLFRPTTLTVALGGPQHISIGGGPESIMSFDEMTVAAPLLTAPGRSADLHAKALRLASAKGGWRSGVGALDGHAALADPADAASQAVLFTANAEAIDLPPVARWPLGPHVASVVLSGKLNGPLPAFQDVPHGAAGWATAWRDGGGSLEVSHLAVGWGPLSVTSSATLALDDQLQPMGSGSAHLVGYAETLDRLAAAGLLTRSAATVAKAILSLMAGTGDGDGPSAVDVPLTLQYRTLSMRQVPLTRLPELDWAAR